MPRALTLTLTLALLGGPLAVFASAAGSAAEPASASLGAAPAMPPATVERTLFLMGTRAVLRVEATDRAVALAASEAAVRSLERSAARLSTWGEAPPDDSPDGSSTDGAGELARLNRAPVGETVVLSPRLAGELRRVEACRQATGGAFDPAVGALVAAWGLRDGGRLPSPEEITRALAADRGGLELRETPAGAVAIRRGAGVVLDEGAWGKGAGLDAAMAVLGAEPAVVAAELDLGGQLAVLRRDRGAAVGADGSDGADSANAPGSALAPAIIDLADPRARDRVVARLEIRSGSVATSGNSERGLIVDGRRIGHLLDPRTGRPAPDFGSITVWAPTALEADCLATGLYVLGPEAALAWAEAHPGIEVVVARVDSGDSGGGGASGVRLQASSGLGDRLTLP